MTLTDAVFWAKRAGIGLVVATLLFIPLRLVFLILSQRPETITETELPYASQGYGMLPEVSLQRLELATDSNPTFFLETPAGEFPKITPVAQVYKLPEKQQSLIALDNAKSLAGKLKFDAEPTRIPNTNKYQWTDNYGRVMVFDVATQNFNLVTDFKKDIYELKSMIPDLATAEQRAIAFLKSFGLYDESYANGFVEKRFLKFGPTGEFLVANSQVEAELIRLDFFRTTKLKQLTEEEFILLEQYEDGNVILQPENVPVELITNVRTQDIIKSNLSITIRGTNFNKIGEIYQMDAIFWPIDETQTQTYYVKNPAEAWEDVKSGKAYLRNLVPKGGEPFKTYTPINVSQFLVYDMSLVYLETAEYQTYLQPVYMIRGEARTVGNTGQPDLDFVFMTPAVKQY